MQKSQKKTLAMKTALSFILCPLPCDHQSIAMKATNTCSQDVSMFRSGIWHSIGKWLYIAEKEMEDRVSLGSMEHICLLLPLFRCLVFALSSRSQTKMLSMPLHNGEGFVWFIEGWLVFILKTQSISLKGHTRVKTALHSLSRGICQS